MTFVNAQIVLPEGRLARTLRVKRGRIDGIDVAPDGDTSLISIAVCSRAWSTRTIISSSTRSRA